MEATYLGYYNFDNEEWRCISKEATVLIESMLEYDPVRRISAEECLNSKWIKKYTKKDKVEAPKMQMALSNLKDFHVYFKLFRLMRNFRKLLIYSLSIIWLQKMKRMNY